MITLIGTRCTCSNAFSRGVLMVPLPIRKFEKHHVNTFSCVCVCFENTSCIYTTSIYSVLCSGDLVRWSHLFPFRTESLSAATPMVLRKRESRCRQNRELNTSIKIA